MNTISIMKGFYSSMHTFIHMKMRTTLMLDEVIVQKLRASVPNASGFVNEMLKKTLFGSRKTMLGAFKGRISGKDKIEDDE